MRRRLVVLAALLAAGAAISAPVEKKKGGGQSFIQLPTLTATILRADRQYGVMTVDVGVDVPDAGLRKRAEQSVPLLRDAFLREMLIYAPSIAPGGAPNPDLITNQLQRATDRTLGRPGAKVLLGSILTN
jgi:hypothetical protein